MLRLPFLINPFCLFKWRNRICTRIHKILIHPLIPLFDLFYNSLSGFYGLRIWNKFIWSKEAAANHVLWVNCWTHVLKSYLLYAVRYDLIWWLLILIYGCLFYADAGSCWFLSNLPIVYTYPFRRDYAHFRRRATHVLYCIDALASLEDDLFPHLFLPIQPWTRIFIK